MGSKTRLPLSAKRKKRRISAGLKKFQQQQSNKTAAVNNNLDDRQEQENCAQNIDSSHIHKTYSISGRRIVKIYDLFQQIKELDNHSPMDCKFSDMDLQGEKKEGLKSGFIFKCKMCNHTETVWSEKKNSNAIDVNTGAVSGTVTTGGGHAQLEEVMCAMDIPPMASKTFRKYEQVVSKGWMLTADVEMTKAAEEEARLAWERGDVDKDGTPLITVVADGSWCKRSYRTNYSSLSGVAAIIGHQTKKVLYIGVKNKYCTPCARAESAGFEPKPHSCYKNWGTNQSSTSMEAAIVTDGFLCSEEMYGIRYARLIADGDSSVYKKILESRPYKSFTVEKVECKNHLLRNLCNKLRAVAITSTREKNTVYLRKKIGENVLRCRVSAAKAATYRIGENRPISEKVEELRKDILNIPSHVFGEHKDCKHRGYFCEIETSSVPSKSNLVPEFIANGLYIQILDAFRSFSRHSRSLIADVTSNPVEQYNSIIAKFIGGKRVNFALRNSYQGRCYAAVVQHNSNKVHYNFHKAVYKSSPGVYTKSMENKRKRKIEQNQSNKKIRKSLFSRPSSSTDQDYGPAAQQPDLDEATMIQESQEFLKSLKKSEDEIKAIERETVHQSESSKWLELRRNLLTASNFGRVCKMRPATGCEAVVKQLLYSVFDCDAMAYGRQYEEIARQEISERLGTQIVRCGLFIDKEHPFLGASPDGLLNDDGLVEIKCPSSARDMTPDEAIKKRKITFWSINKIDSTTSVNKNHNFYYQIQGQLHVTKRKYCFFVLWTPKGTRVERIEADTEFWQNKMLPKLEKFYKNCILPELIDPRVSRSMPIRNPTYILNAKKKAVHKKSKIVDNGEMGEGEEELAEADI